MAVGAPQFALRQDRGRHQSNVPIRHGRGGEPGSDRDEPGRPGAATEDPCVGTASADRCRGAGRRRRRRGGSSRRRRSRCCLCRGGGCRRCWASPGRTSTSTPASATVSRASVYADGVGMMLGPPKTEGAKGRHLLTPVVVELLRRRRRAQDEERQRAGEAWQQITYEGRPIDLVFTTTTGGLVLRQAVTKAVAAAATAAGVDPTGLGTHAGRSTAITVLYAEEGLDLADIARHVGHAATGDDGWLRSTPRSAAKRDGRGGESAARPDGLRT